MPSNSQAVGLVMRSSTARFTAGCRELIVDQAHFSPRFGSLVKVRAVGGGVVYGLVTDVSIQDDMLVRQIVAAGVGTPEIIEDQRQRRAVPIDIQILTTGYEEDGVVRHRLPPQPPRLLDPVEACDADEVVRFSQRHGWLRLVLAAMDAPVDQVSAAFLRAAAGARPSPIRRDFLLEAGRELARLLALDLGRLEGILAQLEA